MTIQLAFAFGILVMVAIIMMVAIVVGMVKVLKIEKQFKEFDRAVAKEDEFIHKRMADHERDLHSEINDTRNRFDQITGHLQRELMAYVDSRIDKSLGSKEKQLLKS